MRLDNTQANIFKVNGGIADVLANRPTAQNTFYLFYSIDTQEIYYDNGTWVLIGSAGGGGGTNIYNTDGTLTGNRTLSGGGNTLLFNGITLLEFIQQQLLINSFLLTTISGQQVDVTAIFTTISGSTYCILNSGTTLLKLEQLTQRFTLESFYTPTSTPNLINGLELDLQTEIYKVGSINGAYGRPHFIFDSQNFRLESSFNGIKNGLALLNSPGSRTYILGQFGAGGNLTQLIVDDLNETFTTFNASLPKGLQFNYILRRYFYGQINGGNTTSLTIDDFTQITETINSGVNNGIRLNFNNNNYQIGQINGGNSTHLIINDNNQHFRFRANNPELIIDKIIAGDEGSVIQCGNALPVTTGNGDLGQSLIATGFDGTGRTILKRGATLTFPLRFNGIPDFIVVGGSGIQNLGTGTTGLYVTGSINSSYNFKRIPCRETPTDYIFYARLEIHTQFGGVILDTGLRVIYSSTTGSFGSSSVSPATRITEFGTNYDTQVQELTIIIPKTIAGNPTNYYKFDVLARRNVAGNTSVIGAFINFSI